REEEGRQEAGQESEEGGEESREEEARAQSREEEDGQAEGPGAESGEEEGWEEAEGGRQKAGASRHDKGPEHLGPLGVPPPACSPLPYIDRPGHPRDATIGANAVLGAIVLVIPRVRERHHQSVGWIADRGVRGKRG